MRRRVRSLVLPLAALGAALALLSTAFLVAPSWSAQALSKITPGVTYRIPTADSRVALTIDDSPDPRGTPRILDVLRENRATATFFVIGERIPGNEALLDRIVREGHELGNHDYHERMSALVARGRLEADIRATHAALAPFGPVRWFRPGSGLVSPAVLAVAREHSYGVALGDVFPLDGRLRWSDFHRWYIAEHATGGSIIILHDAERRGETTAETLRHVLPLLRNRGLSVVTLSRLAGR